MVGRCGQRWGRGAPCGCAPRRRRPHRPDFSILTRAPPRSGRARWLSPNRSRRGIDRPWALKRLSTWRAEPRRRKRSKIRRRRTGTARLGSVCTRPGGSRTKPTGKVSARSPRSALFSRPAVKRLRRVGRARSEIGPFRPSHQRPWALPGSETPSRSAMRPPVLPPTAHEGYPSGYGAPGVP